MSFNLARLNHVFIPTTRGDRDRLRRGWVGFVGRPIAHLYFSLSEEGRVVAVFALLAAFAGLDIMNADNHLLWCGLFAPMVVCYALRPLFPLRRVRIEARGPDRIAVNAPLEIELVLYNESDRDYTNVRIERPLLPWDGRWSDPSPVVRFLPAGESRTVRIGVVFSERGLHDLDSFRAVSVVPLGLCVGRGVEVVVKPFHVVPVPARVERFELPTASRYQRGGVALASKIGESSELLGLRPYRRGDRIRDLHSRSWARLGEPVVREYQQEYFSRVGVILDTEMQRLDERRLEAVVSLTAGVVAHLTRGEALIDVLVTDGEIHAMTIGRGLGHLDRALDHLSGVELRRPVAPGRAGRAARLRAHLEGRKTLVLESSEEQFERLRPYLDRLSCVVIVALEWGARQQGWLTLAGRHGLPARVILLDRDGAADGTRVRSFSSDAVLDGSGGRGLFL